MDKWKGRVALVTGASSGNGAAICKELVKHGMTVVGCGRFIKDLQAVARDAEVPNAAGKMHVIKCNLSDVSEIASMFEEIKDTYGQVDVCINNAGYGANDSLAASGEIPKWKEMMGVNILGLCICTKKSLELMKEEGITDGIIINIGSVMDKKVPDSEENKPLDISLGFYYGPKFIRGLSGSIRQELKAANSSIRVSTISPGSLETDSFKVLSFLSLALNQEEAKKFYSAVQCLQPEHIAQAVVSVLQTPSYLNVQDIMVQPLDYFM